MFKKKNRIEHREPEPELPAEVQEAPQESPQEDAKDAIEVLNLKRYLDPGIEAPEHIKAANIQELLATITGWERKFETSPEEQKILRRIKSALADFAKSEHLNPSQWEALQAMLKESVHIMESDYSGPPVAAKPGAPKAGSIAELEAARRQVQNSPAASSEPSNSEFHREKFDLGAFVNYLKACKSEKMATAVSTIFEKFNRYEFPLTSWKIFPATKIHKWNSMIEQIDEALDALEDAGISQLDFPEPGAYFAEKADWVSGKKIAFRISLKRTVAQVQAELETLHTVNLTGEPMNPEVVRLYAGLNLCQAVLNKIIDFDAET